MIPSLTEYLKKKPPVSSLLILPNLCPLSPGTISQLGVELVHEGVGESHPFVIRFGAGESGSKQKVEWRSMIFLPCHSFGACHDECAKVQRAPSSVTYTLTHTTLSKINRLITTSYD